ncbi:MAG: hypothetical protein M0021_04535 [Clostridia bacterium]|nr:hypothetical protein [Clostridia bacterium]
MAGSWLTTGQVKVETYVNSKDMANVRKGNEVNVVFKAPGKGIKVK